MGMILAQVASAGLIETDSDTKTLVLLDDWATTESHSMFFDHVRTNLGHQVEFSMIKDGA